MKIFHTFYLLQRKRRIKRIIKRIAKETQYWSDYDENGVPYWEKTGTVDPE